MGITGTGQPTGESYQLQSTTASGTGIIYSSNIDGIGTYRAQAIGAGSANVMTVSGSLDGSNWSTVITLTGNTAKIFNVQSYHFIRFECTTYDGSPFTFYWKGDPAVPQADLSLALDTSSLASAANQVSELSKLDTIIAELAAPTQPSIVAIDLTVADTEVPVPLPVNTVKFLVKVRNATSDLKIGFAANSTSSSAYISVPRGTAFREDGILAPNLTLYIQSSKPNQTVEILSWK